MVPPAAPEPAASRHRPAGARFQHLREMRQVAQSSVRTAPSSAPFCGPYVAAAPNSPVGDCVTSDATVSEMPARTGDSPDRSTLASRESASAARRQLVAAAVEEACAQGAEQARAAVGRGATAQSEHDLAAPEADRPPPGSGRSRTWTRRGRPVPPATAGKARTPSASSTTARDPLRRNRPAIGRPRGSSPGPAIRATRRRPRAASSVPSPPSASGASATSSFGRARRQPIASARATGRTSAIP